MKDSTIENRITFEEFKKANDLVNRYKDQCNRDLSLIQEEHTTRVTLENVKVGDYIKVIKDVKPAIYFVKGDSYKVLDKNEKGLFIRKKDNTYYCVGFRNIYGRWGV